MRAVASASSIVSGSPSRGRRHERQHHQVGVGVEEDVLHELIGTDAAQVIEVARPAVRLAARVGREAAQRSRALGQALEPRARRVHEVALHVEDELLALHDGARELRARARPASARRTSRRCGRPAHRRRSCRAAPWPRRRPRRGSSRRFSPSRFALVVAASIATCLASRCTGSSGIGAYSPFEVVSSLTGSRRPSGSFLNVMAGPPRARESR